MNTRPKSQGDKSPSDKSQGGKAGYFKQQPKRTIAAATGAPRREDAMLAATEPVQKQARHVLERAFESIELSFRAAKLGTVAVKSQADRHRADQCLVEPRSGDWACHRQDTDGDGTAANGVFRPAHEDARRPKRRSTGRCTSRSSRSPASRSASTSDAAEFVRGDLFAARAQSHQCGAARRKAGTTIQQLTAAATDAATTRLNAVARP